MLKQAYEYIKKYPLPILLLPFAFSIIEQNFMKLIVPYLGTNSILTIFTSQAAYVGYLLFIFFILKLVFIAGYLPLIIEVVNGNNIELKSFKQFLTYNNFIRIFKLQLVVVPIMLAGFMLLVVPGIIWIVFVAFSMFFLLSDPNISIFESISKSLEKTAGYRLKILFYMCLIAVLGIFSYAAPWLAIITDTIGTSFYYLILAIMFKEANSK